MVGTHALPEGRSAKGRGRLIEVKFNRSMAIQSQSTLYLPYFGPGLNKKAEDREIIIRGYDSPLRIDMAKVAHSLALSPSRECEWFVAWDPEAC